MTICYLPSAAQINSSTYPLPVDSIESASNLANFKQAAGDPASAYPQQPPGYPTNPSACPQHPAGYPANASTYPQQPAGYPTYSSVYPEQPNVSSAYPLQPMGAQTFTVVTVDQPKM